MELQLRQRVQRFLIHGTQRIGISLPQLRGGWRRIAGPDTRPQPEFVRQKGAGERGGDPRAIHSPSGLQEEDP